MKKTYRNITLMLVGITLFGLFHLIFNIYKVNAKYLYEIGMSSLVPNGTASTVHTTTDTNIPSTIVFNNVPKREHIKVDLNSWIQRIKTTQKKPNVLLIIADDMRPEIGAYIHSGSPWLNPNIITPNLDALAGKGLLFRRAYCQFSWCNPSRSSFLTSRRPDTTMVHNNSVYFRQNNPHFTTLPQYFKHNGYQTYSMGKVFHLAKVRGCNDDAYSWSSPSMRYNNTLVYTEGKRAWSAVDNNDKHNQLLQDEYVTEYAKQTLTEIASDETKRHMPFFIAVGLKKPHMNWYFPYSYLHKYPLENITLPFNPLPPRHMPDIGWFESYEVRYKEEYKLDTSHWTHSQPLPSWIIKDLRRAYYTCVTYIDDLIGQILKHLNDLKLSDNTIITFIGDHGYHLGEYNMFGKNTVFEVANNSPLIIHVPGVTDKGMVSDNLVELVDVFPTLVDLTGLPKLPYCPYFEKSLSTDTCTEGTSLMPLFEDPAKQAWKDRVFYQHPSKLPGDSKLCMGYSVRTKQHRYTEWVPYYYTNTPKRRAQWAEPCGVELYDLEHDLRETVNVAEKPEMSALREKLNGYLREGWMKAIVK